MHRDRKIHVYDEIDQSNAYRQWLFRRLVCSQPFRSSGAAIAIRKNVPRNSQEYHLQATEQ